MKRLFVAIAAASLLLFTYPIANIGHSAEVTKSKWEESLAEQVAKWTKDLAKHDKRFKAFLKNNYNTTTLGPNSKQWLLSFHDEKGNPAGYFIVGQANDSSVYEWVLIEYGIGGYSLFEKESVTASGEVVPVYHNPFELYWKVKQNANYAFHHHLSGEEIPVDETAATPLNALKSVSSLSDTHAVKGEHLSDPYDFIFWLKAPSLEEDRVWETLSSLKNKTVPPSVVFQTTSYEGLIQQAFTVTGYHSWDTENYVSIEEQGIIRFIPLSAAQYYGNFFLSDF